MGQSIDILETRLNLAMVKRQQHGNSLELETGIISLRTQINVARAVMDYETLLTYTTEQAEALGFNATFHGCGTFKGNPFSIDANAALHVAWNAGERRAINEIVSRG